MNENAARDRDQRETNHGVDEPIQMRQLHIKHQTEINENSVDTRL